MTAITGQQPLYREQRHRIEEQRRHHLVDAETHSQQGRHQCPQHAGHGAEQQRQRDRDRARQVRDIQPRDGRADRTGEELTLRTDVPIAGPERHCDRQPREQQRGRRQQHLDERVRAAERLEHVPLIRRGRVGSGPADRTCREQEDEDDGERDEQRRQPGRLPSAEHQPGHDTAC
jgi:hypothetical protein